ncbi:hypothetical protein D3C86_1943860 [compost metagenome]
MDHIVSEEQRNFQAAQLHHLILHFTDVFTGHGVKNRPDLTLLNHVADRLFRVIRSDADQTQLADFLINRHFREQFVDEFIACFRG